MIRRRDVRLPDERLAVRDEGGIWGWGAPRESILAAVSGTMRAREPLGGEPLPPIGEHEGAIQMCVDVDAQPGIAPAAWARHELEEAPIQLERVIVLDRAAVLETADLLEVRSGRGGAPRGLGMRGGLGEARIIAGEKAIEDLCGLREGAGLRQAEFDHEAILEGAEEALNPALRLRGVGPDPLDAQFIERPPDLGLPRDAAELVVKGERREGIRAKDAMAISVHCGWKAVAADEVAEEEEVAMGIFLGAEDRAQHAPRGIINGGEEHEAGAAVLEPGMMAAIELDEEAGLRHALPAAAVARGAADAGTADACFAQQPVDRGTREVNVLTFCQELREMAIIAATIAGAGQGEYPRADTIRTAAGGPPATVAMGQGRHALRAHCGAEPADMADRESQELRRRPGREESRVDPWKDLRPLLLRLGQGDRLPVHSPRVTESLNS